ncbi:MAG: ABC transporter ATP-binding protein [Acidobacteria bacterium]|nr:MAG: ABC transporter ATP-binding protein [Acidobacteriota bacterium]
MNELMLRFENVSKRYQLGLTRRSLPSILSGWVKGKLRRGSQPESDRYLWAVKDVSFELRRGESLALVGPNGAGKSTILKLLAKVTRPHSGRITSHGRMTTLIELGAGFHPDLTGAENIYLNGAILGLTRTEIDRHFREIVEFSELDRFMDTPIKRYSSGMYVRLGFAVASCVNPDILLVDEVLAVGDTSFHQKCVNRISELLEKGTAIIFVSHDLWLVQAVCPRAIYIDQGRVRLSGSTSQVIEAYEQDLHRKRAEKLKVSDTADDAGRPGLGEITGIEVISLNGHPELRPDKPAELRVRYVTYAEDEEISLVLRIVRSDGVTCCMMRTKLDEFRVPPGRGEGLISVILDPIQLRGGTYYVQGILRDGRDAASIATGSSDFFSVTGSILTFSDMNGVYEPNRKWKHEFLSARSAYGSFGDHPVPTP